MKLVLRHALPPNTPTSHRIGAFAIETRLVSAFAHGGILLGPHLLHATGAKGVHAATWDGAGGWVVIDLGADRDARTLERFEKVRGAGYDFVGLGAFIVPSISDSQRWYCFELCYYLMTGRIPRERVAPEMLVLLALQMGGHLASPLPDFKTKARAD